MSSSEILESSPKIQVTSEYDEGTGLYYVKNESTGEILYASYDEDDAMLDFYKNNPDYNPNPLVYKKTTLEEYMYGEEGGEIY